ncbi:MAG: hypothetical protein ACPG6B_00665 [Oceanihabitans sp.]
MKYFFFVLSICFSGLVFAQDSIPVSVVETPRIVKKLAIGKSMLVDNYEVKFVKVIEDSRCPTNVSCVWAGQVKVLVAILEKGVVKEEKQITLSTKIPFKNRIGNLISLENTMVSGYNVFPYPEYGSKINPEDYYLQVGVEKE